MKKLSEIIDKANYDVNILGITNDSRKVKQGFLFIATKGFNEDHYFYIDDAIDNGAVFIVIDRDINKNFPHYIVDKNIDINDFYVKCCQKFYDIKLADFNFIGITGTDGKTTTTSIIHQLIDWVYIGTNGVSIGDKEFLTNNTTPEAEELYHYLNVVKNEGFKNVVMEVSSEALLHKRLKGFLFDTIGFTNITEDHLNVHSTIKNYRECKFSLVKYLRKNGKCFVNGDCQNCRLLTYNNVLTYGMNSDNDYVIYDVNELSYFVKFKIRDKNNVYAIESPLLGIYNVYNVTLAFLICLDRGFDSSYLIQKIRELNPIKGRREYLNFGQDFTIILDYAHTYNGIKSLVNSCKKYGKIIVVTGAAGGREKEKRKVIGKFLLENVDVTIFTMDDPRYENVNDIIDDMLASTNRKNYYRIVNRKDAIKKAFSLASKDTVVLVIGKGRDNYMAIRDKKVHYSDYETIKKLFLAK